MLTFINLHLFLPYIFLLLNWKKIKHKIAYFIMRNLLKSRLFAVIFAIIFIMSIQENVNGTREEKNEFKIPLYPDSPPYSYTPDWISENPHYSTGAALADFNRDGWLDIAISDGNDMLPGKLNVYYNNGNGTFPRRASWQSDDTGYNGHIDVADVNGDGWMDVAVAYLGTASNFGPIARVYLNNNGVLSSTPDWTADIIGNAFDVDFGDMNNDGRPDLAVATGWSYNPRHFYHNYVYLNLNGTLEKSASWISNDTNNYQGVLWIDADNDGWLDLAFIGTGKETAIYHNNEGNIEKNASWHTEDSLGQDGIMLTAGDVNMDGFIDLFTTDNIQLGGNGLFKQYNGVANGFFEKTHSWSYYGGYTSAVALADVNFDNKLDLATGAWWSNTHIFCNNGEGFSNFPSWESANRSVIEKIVFGDVGPSLSHEKIFVESFRPDDGRRLFYLSHRPIQGIIEVLCDGVKLDYSEYTYSREHAWVSIGKEYTQSVEIIYKYSPSLDMIVSNWDNDIGNFLYYNKFAYPDLECSGSLKWKNVAPGYTVNGSFEVFNVGENHSLLNWEIESYPEWGEWSFTPTNGENLKKGDKITVEVTVVVPNKKNGNFTGSIKVVNKQNEDDFEIIPVSLTTSLSFFHITQRCMYLLQKIFEKILPHLIENFINAGKYLFG
ncbi:MAG TPA: VCBS repeat-containing protein [Thermoplasmatales archaeon]|nr:VCBS repeat-containing protein [Thermoplasmatales archaeon]